MCGICYVKRSDGKRANKMVIKRYENQKKRGQQGFGFVAIDDNHVVTSKHSSDEETIKKEIDKQSANEMLFHHRYPTSTPNYACTAHPIVVDNPKLNYVYFVVHNGVIWNDVFLREKHLIDGFEYTTEITNSWTSKNGNYLGTNEVKWNDSESLAIELARDLDCKDEDMSGIANVRGSIAFIALQVDKKTGKCRRLYFGRNLSSPLIYKKENNFFSICSEGSGEVVEMDKLWFYDYETDKLMVFNDYKIGGTYSYNSTIYPETKTIEHKHIGFSLPPAPNRPEDKIFEDKLDEKLDAIETADEWEDRYYKLLEYREELKEIIECYDPRMDSITELEYYKDELKNTNLEIGSLEFDAKEEIPYAV